MNYLMTCSYDFAAANTTNVRLYILCFDIKQYDSMRYIYPIVWET